MPQTSCGHVYSKLTLLTSRPLNSNTYVFLFVWSKCGCKKHGLFWRTGGKRGRKGLQWTAVGAKAQMVGDWTLSLDSDQITSLNLTSCSDSEGLGLLESPAHHFADRWRFGPVSRAVCDRSWSIVRRLHTRLNQTFLPLRPTLAYLFCTNCRHCKQEKKCLVATVIANKL